MEDKRILELSSFSQDQQANRDQLINKPHIAAVKKIN